VLFRKSVAMLDEPEASYSYFCGLVQELLSENCKKTRDKIRAAPLVASAQGLVPCGSGALPDCQLCHLFQLVSNILNWVLFIIIPIIAPIFLVIGGIYLLVARGDPGMLTKGKDVLTATVVGLIIVYVAWVVLMTILSFLGVASWTGLVDNPLTPEKEGWWQIQCG